MNLTELEERLAAPKRMKEDFIRFCEANGFDVDMNKTITTLSLYDQVDISGVSTVKLFTGQLTTDRTNIRDSFQRPQSEHVIIYGLRIFQGDNVVTLSDSDWTEVVAAAIKNAVISIEVNGVIQLRNLPLTDLLQDQTGEYYAKLPLLEPIFWGGQTGLVATVDFKGTNSLASTSLRVELLSYGATS